MKALQTIVRHFFTSTTQYNITLRIVTCLHFHCIELQVTLYVSCRLLASYSNINRLQLFEFESMRDASKCN